MAVQGGLWRGKTYILRKSPSMHLYTVDLNITPLESEWVFRTFGLHQTFPGLGWIHYTGLEHGSIVVQICSINGLIISKLVISSKSPDCF